MRKNLKNTLISFLSLGTLLMTLSCSTPWIFVNQSEVDKLLSSPEEIEFEGVKIKLSLTFQKEVYRTQRGCALFLCSKPRLASEKRFSFVLFSDKDIYRSFNKKLNATDLWIINKDSYYLFSTRKIIKYITPPPDDGFISYDIDPPFDYKNNNENNMGIVKFESKDKVFYIRSKITNH